MQPGETSQDLVWPEVTQPADIRIAAIIFADGTHTGHVKDILCGMDVVACIFEGRRGMADGYAELNKQASQQSFAAMTSGLQSDPNHKRTLLTKELANQTPHDRAMHEAREVHDAVLRQKQAEVQAGKLTPRAAQQEVMDGLQKSSLLYEELAMDRGEALQ